MLEFANLHALSMGFDDIGLDVLEGDHVGLVFHVAERFF